MAGYASVYEQAADQMCAHARKVITGGAGEAIFTTEHRPVYTAGTSAGKSELLADKGFEIVHTGCGGQWTYHGPGQLILWPVLDLNKRKRDIRAYSRSEG